MTIQAAAGSAYDVCLDYYLIKRALSVAKMDKKRTKKEDFLPLPGHFRSLLLTRYCLKLIINDSYMNVTKQLLPQAKGSLCRT